MDRVREVGHDSACPIFAKRTPPSFLTWLVASGGLGRTKPLGGVLLSSQKSASRGHKSEVMRQVTSAASPAQAFCGDWNAPTFLERGENVEHRSGAGFAASPG